MAASTGANSICNFYLRREICQATYCFLCYWCLVVMASLIPKGKFCFFQKQDDILYHEVKHVMSYVDIFLRNYCFQPFSFICLKFLPEIYDHLFILQVNWFRTQSSQWRPNGGTWCEDEEMTACRENQRTDCASRCYVSTKLVISGFLSLMFLLRSASALQNQRLK